MTGNANSAEGDYTQRLRGRPVTNAEAMDSAQRLINRAHNAGEPKSTMSIPAQVTDDDIVLTDYLKECKQAAARVPVLETLLVLQCRGCQEGAAILKNYSTSGHDVHEGGWICPYTATERAALNPTDAR